MSKLSLFAAAAFGLSAAAAFAQAPPEPSPLPETPPEIAPENPPPPPDGSLESDATGGKDEWRMRPTTDRPSPLRRERGARFRIETGRTTIDLRCAEGEPTKDCADLLLQVLDRIQGASSRESDARRDYRDQGYDRDRYERR